MIVPLKIPPGAYRNGTEYSAKGRWRDVNCVRWRDGVLAPVGGWQGYTTDVHSGIARGAMAWTDNSGNGYVIFGTATACYVLEDDGTVTDITPTLTAGNVDGASWSGPATTWSFGAFGQVPIACSDADGKLWEWNLNTANNLTQVTGSPTSCVGVVVTPERFVVALGDGGDPRSVRWSDRDDRTTWTPATTNQAGGFDLPSEGEIRFALPVRGETLVVTTRDAWSMRYVGYPNVYEFIYLGPCSAASKLCGATIGDRAFWWGEGETFFTYAGGFIQEVPCDVWDYLKTNAATDTFTTEKSKVAAWHNREFSEVWWLYESAGSSSDVDSYVAFDYRENVWHYGECGATTLVTQVPVGKAIGFHVPGSELVTNGGFSSGSNWTISGAGGTWTIGSGVATGAPSGAPGQTLTSDALAVKGGASYVVTFTVTRTAGSVQVAPHNVSLAAKNDTNILSASGTYKTLFVGSGDGLDSLAFSNVNGAFDGTLDNVSVVPATIYEHEVSKGLGPAYGDHYTSNDRPYAETGPLEVGDGERRAHVTRVIPDEQTTGETKLTFSHREYPTSTETTQTAVTCANPTDVRFSGRQFTMRVEDSGAFSTSLQDWRVGTVRLDVQVGGKR